MPKVDWFYYRTGCTGCAKTEEFLKSRRIKVEKRTSASRRLQAPDALELIKKSDEIYTAKGQQTRHFKLREQEVDQKVLLGHMLGLTGNLRAPLVITGKTMLVGFNRESFEEVFS